MTKNSLIKKLQKIPGNPIIVGASDGEGNSFSMLEDISGNLLYNDETREVTDEEDIKDPDYGLDIKDFKKCIVLWPN